MAQQETDKAAESLSRALKICRNIDDILLVTGAVVDYRKDNLTSDLIQLLPSTITELDDYMKVIDVFLDNGRKEEAGMIFSGLITQISRSTSEYQKKLLFLVDGALQRNLLDQAVNAIYRLSSCLGREAYEYSIQPSISLKNVEDLPDRTRISLPLFYGLLNEELKFNDTAEDVYIQAVLFSLKKILGSYGYQPPETLNEYYLLGKSWINADRGDLLTKLDSVYTLLEEQFSRQLIKKNNQDVEDQQENMNQLKEQQASLVQKVEELKKKEADAHRKMILHLIFTLSVALFLMLVLVGCIVTSYQYSKKLTKHRTFGFISKLLETTGWVRVMSIIGFVSGLVAIFIAQLLQIFQQSNEAVFHMAQLNESKNRKHENDYIIPDKVTHNGMNKSSQEG